MKVKLAPSREETVLDWNKKVSLTDGRTDNLEHRAVPSAVAGL